MIASLDPNSAIRYPHSFALARASIYTFVPIVSI